MNASAKRKRDGTSTLRLSRSSATYEYESLPTTTSIRILELQPGEKPSIIECKLSIVERDAAPQYESLSYTWGSHTNTRLISCEGQKLKITANLRDALWSIRDPHKVRHLWADAICINQKDDVERAHQVRQMPFVYMNAVRVLVWLNLHTKKFHDFEELFGFDFNKISGNGQLSTILHQLVARLEAPNLQAENLDSETAVIAKFFSHIFDSPYFLRLWVVQEVGMAKSVVALIGGATIDFIDLIRFILRLERRTLLMDNLGLFTAGKATVFTTFPARSRELSGEVDDDYDFLEMMEVTRAQLGSDPHDYVYALLGHPSAQVGGGPIVEPNYSIAPEDLFFEVTEKIIVQTQSLRILSAVHQTEDRLMSKTPSWVPSWARPPVSLLSLGVYRDRYYDVELDTAAGIFCEMTTSQKVLQVQGFIFDEISKVENDGALIVPRNMQQLFLTGLGLLSGKRSSGKSKALETLKEVGQTIAAGFRNTAPVQFAADFSAFRLHLIREAPSQAMELAAKLAPEGINALQESAQQGTLDEIYWAASRFCAGRLLFVTKQGMLGLGPSIMREGDICCVLFGAPVPFVLRPIRDKQFKLVGEAYVQGIMKGEAVVDFMLSERFKQQTFELL